MKETKEILAAAIFDVFERMFYVFFEPVNDESSIYDMEALVSFGGASKGELRLSISDGLAKIMAQNLLGVDEGGIIEEDVEDCVKEAANMVCGNFLGKFDKTKVFDLSIASFSRHFGENAVIGSRAFRLEFDSDGGRLGVVLSMSD